MAPRMDKRPETGPEPFPELPKPFVEGILAEVSDRPVGGILVDDRPEPTASQRLTVSVWRRMASRVLGVNKKLRLKVTRQRRELKRLNATLRRHSLERQHGLRSDTQK